MKKLSCWLCTLLLLAGAASAAQAGGNDAELQFLGVEQDMGLDYPYSLASSPNGNQIYVASQLSNALTVFDRDALTQRVSYKEKFIDGEGGVDGLDGALSVAVSPDGGHVYVASNFDHALAYFTRAASTGSLTFEAAYKDGVGGVDGLDGANCVALDPAGENVYVTGAVDQAIAVFSRDSGDGALTLQQVIKEGDPGVEGLDYPVSVEVSPDGNHVYVADTNSDAISIFTRNLTTGLLVYSGIVKDTDPGVDGLDAPQGLAFSEEGNYLYVVGYMDNSVTAFSRDDVDGSLSFVEIEREGVNGITSLYFPSGLVVDATGTHLYVTAKGDNAVSVFHLNDPNGEMTFIQAVTNGSGGVTGLGGPWSVAVSPDGGGVYALGGNSDALVAFDRDSSSGVLSFLEAELSSNGLGGAVGLALSPEGDFLYVTGNDADAMAFFTRDAASGEVAYQGKYIEDPYNGFDGLDGARAVLVTPDGKDVYVAGHDEDKLLAARRSTVTGALTFVEVEQNGVGGVTGLDGPQGLAVSPDGLFIYAANEFGDAVVAFSRDPGTGQLTWLETETDGAAGVDGLDAAYAMAISPDGGHLYAAGFSENELAIFSRNPANGQLEFLDVIQEGGGVDGLGGVNSIVLSPGGEHLYAASRGDDAVTFFSRNTSTGGLTYQSMYQDGLGGVDGLDGARAIAISPDGLHLAVASQFEDALALFSRDPATGALTFLRAYRDNDSGFDGLDAADSLAFSPDSRNLYVSSYGDDAVAIFERQLNIYLPALMK